MAENSYTLQCALKHEYAIKKLNCCNENSNANIRGMPPAVIRNCFLQNDTKILEKRFAHYAQQYSLYIVMHKT